MLSKPIQNAVEQLQRLPSVGPKSAQRLAYYFLRRPEADIQQLIDSLISLKRDLVTCEQCFNVVEESPCAICSHPQRSDTILCVIEEPLDLVSIEKTGKHMGKYHVLGGVINPLLGVGPEEIRVLELISRVKALLQQGESVELIIATNPSLEGETTALYIKKQCDEMRVYEGFSEDVLKISRIARGLPTGGDVEYADQVTLGRALDGRVYM